MLINLLSLLGRRMSLPAKAAVPLQNGQPKTIAVPVQVPKLVQSDSGMNAQLNSYTPGKRLRSQSTYDFEICFEQTIYLIHLQKKSIRIIPLSFGFVFIFHRFVEGSRKEFATLANDQHTMISGEATDAKVLQSTNVSDGQFKVPYPVAVAEIPKGNLLFQILAPITILDFYGFNFIVLHSDATYSHSI